MRNNKTFSREPSPQKILFEQTHESAEKICIAGSFNDWSRDSTRMISIGNGHWIKILLLPPGIYGYFYIIDGIRLLNRSLCNERIPVLSDGMITVFHVPNSTIKISSSTPHLSWQHTLNYSRNIELQGRSKLFE